MKFGMHNWMRPEPLLMPGCSDPSRDRRLAKRFSWTIFSCTRTRRRHLIEEPVRVVAFPNQRNEQFFRAHPDWMARNSSGEPYRNTDLYVTCVNSPYYDEYLPAVLTEIIERSRTPAGSHHWVQVVEVMGRYAGWIALHSGLAGSADVILIPEIPFDVEKICERLRETADPFPGSRAFAAPPPPRRW